MIIEHNGEKVSLGFEAIYEENEGQVCIQAYTVNGGEDWATFTVCIPNYPLKRDYTVLDTNNYPEILGILIEAGVVEDSGYRAKSGFCEYAVVKIVNQCNERENFYREQYMCS